MRTKSTRKNKINIVTLGCSKNAYDSEVLSGQLQAAGKDVVHEEQEGKANIIVVNTCGFIDNAKEESVNTILHFANEKAEGRIDELFVTGCLSERYKPDLEREIPEVDQYFGTRDLPLLLKALGADYKHELVGERLLTTPRHYAYLKIAEGCDRPCAFCAIPLMRGGHKSKPIEELVTEAGKLAAKGVKELILIAQDLTYYGLDLYKKRELAKLLKELVKVEDIEWIRLHYLFPTGFPEDVLDVIREEPKVCNYIDIPLQHIADPVLKRMRRGTTMEKTNRLIEEMRKKVPGIVIRTTLIAGFPGETEEDFQTMLQWVKDSKFNRLGCFTYSHEENTHAFNYEDDVPQDVKKDRVDLIMEAQQDISRELNQKMIGNTYRVIIDRKEGDRYVARTEFDSPDVDNEVLIDARETYLSPGTFVNVKITSAEDYDLFAEVI
ncbi:MAG: 30S ribosomal protein S12 methylthiotransferase RimO [Flavobacteriales bacterium]|nr:MAG: 30S ribosomal protein S12 methylthiotransferase RimO [Flavobacteriales bacterium]